MPRVSGAGASGGSRAPLGGESLAPKRVSEKGTKAR